MSPEYRGVYRALAIMSVSALLACGTDAPMTAPMVGPNLTGSWRFSWTLEDTCQIEVDFELVQALSGYFQGSETGAPPTVCISGWPTELRRGTLMGRVSDDGSLWFRVLWKDEGVNLNGTARLETTLTEMLDGQGGWEFWEVGGSWEDALEGPWRAPGTFTAALVTPQ